MNTTENNRLLAEFIGWELKHNPNISQKTWSNKEEGYCRDKDSTFIEYSNNWNWLMKVVEKIESLGFTFTIRLKWVKISKTHNSDEVILIRWEEDETKIEAVYNACLEFIEWYNENVKSAEKK